MTRALASATALIAVLLVPSLAFAELRKVDLKTLGMD